jgi:hypothetical protein
MTFKCGTCLSDGVPLGVKGLKTDGTACQNDGNFVVDTDGDGDVRIAVCHVHREKVEP